MSACTIVIVKTVFVFAFKENFSTVIESYLRCEVCIRLPSRTCSCSVTARTSCPGCATSWPGCSSAPGLGSCCCGIETVTSSLPLLRRRRRGTVSDLLGFKIAIRMSFKLSATLQPLPYPGPSDNFSRNQLGVIIGSNFVLILR